MFRAALFVLIFGTPAASLAAAPAAATLPASSITTSSAILNGSGTPGSESTIGYFRYSATNPGTCDDAFGTRVPVVSGTDLGAGSSTVSYSITTTGLRQGVTYYYCAVVKNASGTAFGAIQAFTIPSAPVVTTGTASSLTSSSATLEGSANPVAASTIGWFRYDLASPGTCNDAFGIRTPATSGTSLGAGSASVPYAQGITGLLPGTTYYFCAIASNTYGTTYGAIQSFTTPAMAPTVSTSSATITSGTVVTLRGSGNPNGDATTGWFRYGTVSPGTCNDTFGTKVGGAALGAGTSYVSFSQAAAGLTPGTTYYYCALGSNALGLGMGTVRSFTTPASPLVVTQPASGLTATTATLNGSGTPNRAETTGWFRFSTTNPGTCNDAFGSRAPSTGGVALGPGTTSVPFAQSISGLSGGTTYYYCAIAASSEGTVFGSVLSLTTAGAPTAATLAASGIATGSATLNGSGNPNGASATGWFRYDTTSPAACNDTFGVRAPSSSGTALGSGSSAVPYAQSVGGLLPGTKYYYCAIAQNPYGLAYGELQSFTTPALAPTVSTGSASVTSGTAATLQGSANPNGDATTGWFRYGTASPGTCNDTFGTKVGALLLLRHRRLRAGSGDLVRWLLAGGGRADAGDPVLLLRAGVRMPRCAGAVGGNGTQLHHALCPDGDDGGGEQLHGHLRGAQRNRNAQPGDDHGVVPLQLHQPRHVQRRLREPRAADQRHGAGRGNDQRSVCPEHQRSVRRHHVLLLRHCVEQRGHRLRRGALVHHGGAARGHHQRGLGAVGQRRHAQRQRQPQRRGHHGLVPLRHQQSRGVQ
ncbi:MAG: hypothetical protein U1A78_26125 [Polyangia bacterium]